MEDRSVRDVPKDKSGLNRTCVETAYWYVRKRILNMSYKPGQDINDATIASSLGISRTPVRDALRRLEMEGLAEYSPRHGWSIFALRLEDVVQIFTIKDALESMLARESTSRMTEDDDVELGDAMAAMDAAAEESDLEAWLEAERRWHRALNTPSGNERAIKFLDIVNAQWHWMMIGLVSMEGRMRKSVEEHRAVVQAVLARDSQAAQDRMHEHQFAVKGSILHVLTHFVAPFACTSDHHPNRTPWRISAGAAGGKPEVTVNSSLR